jgi:DNA modification methylase
VVWTLNPDKDNKFPAPFPIELPLNCILSCTDEGDVVYDPFMGSGTTALACKQTNRRYIGSEIGNIDVSNNRLNKIESYESN